jgi:tetratricopeptide (TPR) repeat protein
MKMNFARAAVGAWLLGTAAAALAMAPAASIAADKSAAGPKATKAVGIELQAAITAAQAKDFATAQQHIAAAKAAPNQNDFDPVEIDIVSAFVALGQNDHAAALAAYKRIIASPYFTQAEKPEDQVATLKNTMMLQAEAKDYAGAVQTGERLAATGSLDDKAAASLATAYYFNKDYVKARSLAQKAIDAAAAAHTKPDQAAMQIMFNSYADQNDQENARKYLEMMISYYPDANSWAKLIDNAVRPGLSDMQLLQLYRLRVLSGAKGDAEDYILGSDLAIKNGYPGDARSMLQAASSRGVSGIGAKLSQAQAKAAADEKTLPGNDAAAAKSKTGQMDVLVAEQYFGYGRFDEAAAAAQRAISKGGLKDPEEPKMVVGMSLASSGKYPEAIQALQQVGGSDAQRRMAHLWIVYAQSKSGATAAATP